MAECTEVASSIYIVMGNTGEYSDKREWTVVALYSRSAADKYADACKLEAHRIQVRSKKDGGSYYTDRGSYYTDQDKPEWLIHKFDPNFYMDYTGTDYYVVDVPLHRGHKTLPELEAERAALEARLVEIDAQKRD